jgi:hypothetical protein
VIAQHSVHGAEVNRSSRLVELTAVSVALAALALIPGGRAEAGRERLLTVQVVGGGTVSSRDRRIGCAARCVIAYPRGRIVEIRASPKNEFEFERWDGDCVGRADSCLIALDRRASVRAVFTRQRTSVRLVVAGAGAVSSEPPGLACGASGTACTADFGLGTAVQLFAAPAPGAELHSWGDGCQRTGPTSCLLLVRSGNEISATFRAASRGGAPQELRVDNPGSARVTSDPPGLDCPPTCSASFDPDVLVRLRGVGVTRWRERCVGVGSRCDVVVDAPTIVAVDSPPRGPAPPRPAPAARRYGLLVSVWGRGVVTGGTAIRCGAATSTASDCQGYFIPNERLTLRAVAGPRSRFGGWGGFCSGKMKTCTVRVTTTKDVMAIFRPRRARR